MRSLLRVLFVVLVAYPVVLLWLGLNVRHRERLPARGPAVVAANHNSHLDTLTLFTLFPLGLIARVHPVAAADYFTSNPWIAWFSRNVVGIIPVVRGSAKKGIDPLQECHDALRRGEILIIFPEGTRGEPEQMAAIKSGIWHLGRQCPQATVVPVFMHGLGRSMPKGSIIPLPLFVDVYVGHPLQWCNEKAYFMTRLAERFSRLKSRLENLRGAAGWSA